MMSRRLIVVMVASHRVRGRYRRRERPPTFLAGFADTVGDRETRPTYFAGFADVIGDARPGLHPPSRIPYPVANILLGPISRTRRRTDDDVLQDLDRLLQAFVAGHQTVLMFDADDV